ncbi:MAG: 5-bromo-4-chloroindolyl phosphate hydrolysis family protein [Pseudomonadota bacterium]
MAKHFGGEHSPRSAERVRWPFSKKPKVRGRIRNWFLFVAPLPLLFLSLFKEPIEMLVDISAASTLVLAAWLLQEGLKAEHAYMQRTIARRPAFPRKLFASLLTGIGVSLAAMDGLSGFPGVAVYGIIAAGLHSFSFGLDPMSDKGIGGVDTFQSERVARALETAENQLFEMQEVAERLPDRSISERIERFNMSAREVFRAVEQDPRDLFAARKFLGIYLKAACDATKKFAEVFTASQDQKAKHDYFSLLDDLQRSFDSKREKLLIADKEDLDIEIEVLRDRLKRDGIVINNEKQ